MWIQETDVLKKYLIDDQSLPSRKDLAQDPYWQNDPIIKVFIDGFSVAKPRAYGPNYPKISNAVQQAFQAAMSGQMPPADALKQASDTVKPLLTA
jgi:multiple sugar transport system substrate-binding protein